MLRFIFSKKTAFIVAGALIITLAGFMLSACGTNDMILRASKNATTYNIDAIYNDDTKMLYGSQSVNYKNNSGVALETLNLHLYPNAFREDAIYKPVSQVNEVKAYPNGFSAGNIEIKNVKVNNKASTFEIGGVDKNILIIPLTSALQPKSSIEFSLEFDVLVPNIKHRFGYTDKSVNLGNWYPIMCAVDDGKYQMEPYSYNGDPFYSNVANYNVKLTTACDFVVAHTGDKISENEENHKTTYNLRAKAVRDFALCLSKEFNHKSKKVGSTTVNYYYYGDTQPVKSLETCVKSVKTFNSLFGGYPYSKLDVVETGFVHGGMEFPNLVYIADNLENYEDYTNVIIHEIAHQWWYGVVGDNQVKDAWIDEGLAEYSTAMFYDKNPEYGIKKDTVLRNTLNSYLLFIDVYKDIFDTVDTSMNRKLTDYKTEPEYTYMA